MSGEGSPSVVADASDLRLCIIAASWHQEVMDGLIAGAQSALAEAGATDVTLVRIPGSFELPVAALKAAEKGYDAVIALGVIVRGTTPHFEFVSRAATDGLTQVALRTGVPIGFGVLTCDNEGQARDRAGLPGSHEDKGAESALAAVATVRALRTL